MPTYEIESPDGTKYHVDAPEGASQEQAFEFFKRNYKAPPAGDRRSVFERLGTGAMDPIHGTAQLLSHAPGASYVNRFNNYLADLGVPLARIPEGGVDEMVRQREEEIQKARGGETGTDWWRVAGSLPTYIAGGEVAPELLAGRGILGAAKVGASAGALQPTTGRPENFWAEKASQAGEGALFGGGVGVGGKIAGKGLEKLGAKLANRFGAVKPNVISKIAGKPTLEEVQKALKKAQTQTMKLRGRQEVLERIRQDKKATPELTQTEIARLVNDAQKRDIPMVPLDFMGESGQSLGGNIARMPGPARNMMRQFLEERDRGEGAYLTKMVRRYLHGLHPSGDATAYETAENLMSKRSTDAKPLYEKVAALEIPMSPTLQVILEDPIVRASLKPGFELERIRAAAEGRKFDPADLGLFPDEEGQMAVPRAPSMRVIDIAKQGLDTLIEKERNEVTGRLTRRGMEINYLRRALLGEVDKLDTSGVYKAARNAWEGPSASLDALKLGRSVFSAHPEEFAAEFGKLSDADQDFVRVGVADSAIEKILKVGLHGDEAKALVRSPWVQEQLRPVFRGPKDFEAFMQEVEYAVKRFETKRGTIGGSDTARRVAEDTGMQGAWAAASISKNLLHGDVMKAISDAYRWWRDIGFRPDPEMNEAIAKVLLAEKLPKGFRTPKLINYGEMLSDHLQRLGVKYGAPVVGAAAGQP